VSVASLDAALLRTTRTVLLGSRDLATKCHIVTVRQKQELPTARMNRRTLGESQLAMKGFGIPTGHGRNPTWIALLACEQACLLRITQFQHIRVA